MSGLFSSKTKSSSTSSTQVPQNYQNFLNMSLQRASDAGNAPFVQYQGQRIADMSGNEQMGIQGAASNYGMYQPLLDMASMSSADLATKAGRAPTQTEMGNFINPYVDYVLGNSLDRLQEQSDINMTKIGSSAGMSGAFGGLRHGVLEGANLGELLKSARDLSGTTYSDAYDKGMGNWWKSQDSQRASIDTLLGTARGAQAYNQGDINQLMSTGLTERTRNQGLLDFNFGEFMREQEDPLTKASFMSSIAAQYPRDIFTKTTKTESTTQDSPLKTIAGIGLAAAGIMSGNPAAALSMGAGATATRAPTSILPQSYQPPDYGRIYAEGGLIKGYAEGGSVKDPLKAIPVPRRKPNEKEHLKGLSYKDAMHFLDQNYEAPYDTESTALPYYQGMVNWYDHVAKQQPLTPSQQRDRDWFIGHRDVARGIINKDEALMNAGYRQQHGKDNAVVTRGDEADWRFNYSGEEERLMAEWKRDRRELLEKQAGYPSEKNRKRKYAEGGFLDDIRAWGDDRDMGMVKAGLSLVAGADPLEAMDAYKEHQRYLQQGGYQAGGYVHGKVGKSKKELDEQQYLTPLSRIMKEVEEERFQAQLNALKETQRQEAAKHNTELNARRRGIANVRTGTAKPVRTPEGDPNYFNRFQEPLRQDVEPPPIDEGALDAWLDYQAMQNGTYEVEESGPFIESYNERQKEKKKKGYFLGGAVDDTTEPKKTLGSWFGRMREMRKGPQRRQEVALQPPSQAPFSWDRFNQARAMNGQLTNLTGGMQPRVPMGQRPDLSMYVQAMQNRMQPQQGQPAFKKGGKVTDPDERAKINAEIDSIADAISYERGKEVGDSWTLGNNYWNVGSGANRDEYLQRLIENKQYEQKRLDRNARDGSLKNFLSNNAADGNTSQEEYLKQIIRTQKLINAEKGEGPRDSMPVMFNKTFWGDNASENLYDKGDSFLAETLSKMDPADRKKYLDWIGKNNAAEDPRGVYDLLQDAKDIDWGFGIGKAAPSKEINDFNEWKKRARDYKYGSKYAAGGQVKKYAGEEGSFVQGGRSFNKSQERVPADDIDPLSALYYGKKRKDLGSLQIDPLAGRDSPIEFDNVGTTSKAALRRARNAAVTPTFNSMQDVLTTAPKNESVERLRPDFKRPHEYGERLYSDSRMWDGVNEDVFMKGTFSNEQSHKIKDPNLSLNPVTQAFGQHQFVPDTWNFYVNKIPKAAREQLGIFKVDRAALKKLSDGDERIGKFIPSFEARDYVYRNFYLPDSYEALKKANLPITELNLYLAHHLGQEGATKAIPLIFKKENQNRTMKDILMDAGLKKAARSKGNSFETTTAAEYIAKKERPYKNLRGDFAGQPIDEMARASRFAANKGEPPPLDIREFSLGDVPEPRNYREEQRALLAADGRNTNELSPLHGLEPYRKSALIRGGRGFNKGGYVQKFREGGGPVMRDSLGNVIPESKDEDTQSWYERYLEGIRTPISKGWGDLNDFFAAQTGVLPTNRGDLPTSYPVVQKIAPAPAAAKAPSPPASIFSGSNFFDSTSDDVAGFYDELGSMVDADPLNGALEAGDDSAPMQDAVESGLKQDEDDIMLKQMMREQIQAMRDNKSPQQPTLFGLNVNMDLVKLGLGMLASDKNFGGALGEAGMGLIQDKEKEELRKSRENSEKLKDILDLRYKNAMMESMDPEVKRELARQKHQQDMQLERMKRDSKLEEIGLTGANYMARTLNIEKAKRLLDRGPPYSDQEKSWAWALGIPLQEEPPPPVIKH